MSTIVEIKNQILKSASIVDVVQRYVQLKRKGNEWLALCPFHNERSPSFSVNERKSVFKCFGCGAGGDVIDFIMKHENKTFTEALDIIANLQHIPIEWNSKEDVPEWSKESFEKIEIVDPEILRQTMTKYEANPLAVWLIQLVGWDRAVDAIAKYHVGTASNQGTIFWQVDQMQRVRTAQKIHYGDDGHRLKAVKPMRLFVQEKGYQPCLFGEHLLMYATKEHLIGIVESEKTAIICSIYFPTLMGRPIIWLACSGSNGLTAEKIWVLKGMDIVLVPDFSYTSRAMWGAVEMRKKLQEVNGKERKVIAEDGEVDKDYVSASDRLRRLCSSVMILDDWKDINDGSDIADLLIQYELPDTDVQILPPDELELPVEGFD